MVAGGRKSACFHRTQFCMMMMILLLYGWMAFGWVCSLLFYILRHSTNQTTITSVCSETGWNFLFSLDFNCMLSSRQRLLFWHKESKPISQEAFILHVEEESLLGNLLHYPKRRVDQLLQFIWKTKKKVFLTWSHLLVASIPSGNDCSTSAFRKTSGDGYAVDIDAVQLASICHCHESGWFNRN